MFEFRWLNRVVRNRLVRIKMTGIASNGLTARAQLSSSTDVGILILGERRREHAQSSYFSFNVFYETVNQ